MPITERDLLDEIGNIIADTNVHGTVGTSRERARNFHNPLDLPKKLKSYIKDSRKDSMSNAAKMFGMSPHTLKNIIDGGPLSENMLFRLRNSLEYAVQHPGISVMRDESDVYFGDWRKTNTAEIQAAISQVADRLIYLKKVVETSNSLKGPDAPIDEIQLAQLIALLEATLAALKAPYVEKQQTAGALGYFKKLGKRVFDKKAENAFSNAIDEAVDAGSDLLDKLADAPGVSDLGGLIT